MWKRGKYREKENKTEWRIKRKRNIEKHGYREREIKTNEKEKYRKQAKEENKELWLRKKRKIKVRNRSLRERNHSISNVVLFPLTIIAFLFVPLATQTTDENNEESKKKGCLKEINPSK